MAGIQIQAVTVVWYVSVIRIQEAASESCHEDLTGWSSLRMRALSSELKCIVALWLVTHNFAQIRTRTAIDCNLERQLDGTEW